MYRTKAPPNKYYCQTVSLWAYDLNIIILTMRIFGIAPTASGHRQRQRHVYRMRWCHIHLTIICILIHLSKNFQCTYNLNPLPLTTHQSAGNVVASRKRPPSESRYYALNEFNGNAENHSIFSVIKFSIWCGPL